ncbi:UDP-4-amino-4,6-dideoxy-N-acetyl-beta-L-altrosamine transaminase [Jannaschia sp. EhC01]|nr:UDP-4-amino-4,6-dideoxy-N-acetyl-beta-L-altrosamine transaminase [Jannaschia sp. EhC01]
MIPYGRQDITQDDIDGVLEVLTSDFLTQGPRVPAFEEALASHIGAPHAVAVNSATSALHIACLALGLGAGDRLWTSPITFVASANAGLYCGAEVDFVDIDAETFNMCPKALAAKLELAEREGTLPKIVVPVDMCGQSCDMAAIRALAYQYGFKIIEDASHAIGGRYRDAFVGAHGLADITVFSFHPVKIITTAEGGMAVTNDADLARKMGYFRSHGVTRDADLMEGDSDGPWYYQQIDLGYNYRMTEMQAALGVTQMQRLDAYVTARAARADRYDAELAGLALDLPGRLEDASSSWHLYVIRLQDAASRRPVFEGLRAAGLGVNVHYIPVHFQPHYRRMGFNPGDFPVAEDYYSRAISIPLYATMSDEQQSEVISAIKAEVAA